MLTAELGIILVFAAVAHSHLTLKSSPLRTECSSMAPFFEGDLEDFKIEERVEQKFAIFKIEYLDLGVKLVNMSSEMLLDVPSFPHSGKMSFISETTLFPLTQGGKSFSLSSDTRYGVSFGTILVEVEKGWATVSSLSHVNRRRTSFEVGLVTSIVAMHDGKLKVGDRVLYSETKANNVSILPTTSVQLVESEVMLLVHNRKQMDDITLVFLEKQLCLSFLYFSKGKDVKIKTSTTSGRMMKSRAWTRYSVFLENKATLTFEITASMREGIDFGLMLQFFPCSQNKTRVIMGHHGCIDGNTTTRVNDHLDNNECPGYFHCTKPCEEDWIFCTDSDHCYRCQNMINKSMVAGLILGGITLLSTMVAAVVWVCIRRRRRNQMGEPTPEIGKSIGRDQLAIEPVQEMLAIEPAPPQHLGFIKEEEEDEE